MKLPLRQGSSGSSQGLATSHIVATTPARSRAAQRKLSEATGLPRSADGIFFESEKKRDDERQACGYQARRSRDQCEGWEVLPDFLGGGRAGGLAAGGVAPDSLASQCIQWGRGAAAPLCLEPREEACAELAALEKAVACQLSERSLDESKLFGRRQTTSDVQERFYNPQTASSAHRRLPGRPFSSCR